MKLILTALIGGLFCTSLFATDPIYINDSPTANPPPIDATTFLNRSIFTITAPSSAYNTKNTTSYTNTASGTMSAVNGFQFLTVVNATKKAAINFHNEGVIDGGSYLEIQATNLFNNGPMSVSSQGKMIISGSNLMLNRNGLRAGDTNGGLNDFSCFISSYGVTNYINDIGVADVWWARGTNNYLTIQAPPVSLPGLLAGINPPTSVVSPIHQVVDSSFFNLTTTVSVGGSDYAPFVYTKSLGGNKKIVQIVLVQTNFATPNASTDVRFYDNGFDGGTVATVAYHLADLDKVLQRTNIQSVFLVDASLVVTNMFLSRNPFVSPATRRPNTMEVTTLPPCEYVDGVPANGVYSGDLVYNPLYRSNTVQMRYSGYLAGINGGGNGLTIGGYVNPTTLPGTIQITGTNVSLEQTRIRAENTVAIKVANLVSNKVAGVDAPYLVYDLTSTQPQLVVSNLAPASVHRLSGGLAAWSGTWTNFEDNGTVTNEIKFHLLIVENGIRFEKPAIVDSLFLKAPAIVAEDNLNVQTSFRLDTSNMTVRKSLTLPVGNTWSSTNVFNVVNYTNEGTVNIYRAAYYGTDRPQAYSSFVNKGTHTAAAHLINSVWFDNKGTLQSSSGTLSISADKAFLMGVPVVYATNVFTNLVFQPGVGYTNVAVTNVFNPISPSKLGGNGDVILGANSLILSNALIQAGIANPARFDLSITNRLVDSGQGAINNIFATAGMNLLVRPAFSDMLATYVTCKAPENGQVFNTWSADDRGATASGFTNNAAIGKLTLDGGEFSVFRFAAPNGQTGKALYVEYLELLNYATNYLTGSLSIDPSITIYFANGNETATKLDGSNGGRLRWVKSFTGPLSSTNITYPSGQVVTMNVALATSKDIDSDCDGIVNADDPTPLYSADQALLSATRIATNKVALTWKAICGSTSWVEYKPSFTNANWLPLTQYVNSTGASTNFTFLDAVTNKFRIYRLRVNPPQL